VSNAYILFDNRGYVAGVFSSRERLLAAKERYLLGNPEFKRRYKGMNWGEEAHEIDFLWEALQKDQDIYKVVLTYDLDCVIAIEKMTPTNILDDCEELPSIAESRDYVTVYNVWASSKEEAFRKAKSITTVEGVRHGLRVYRGAVNGG